MNDIEILHDDEDIVIINKPSGLLSVPGRIEPDSAVSRLLKIYDNILIIHRLDMDTSGILVFARHKTAQANIQRQFEKQTTRKVYEALLIGEPKGSHGCINLPIIVDWPNRPLQMISHCDGRYALTRWKKIVPVENQSAEFCRVELYPKTGRSHQLRIHMQQIGHPIHGDTLYAGEPEGSDQRLCLHARELDFNHPTTGERIEVRCKAPF